MLAIYRRPNRRIVKLMYVIGEATSTLLAVYGRERFTPLLLCLIQMGYGLGGGWDRFFDSGVSDCTMRHAFRLHPAGMPPWILSNSYLPPEEFQVVHRFASPTQTPFGDALDLRRTHHRYFPQEGDRDFLSRTYPVLAPLPEVPPGELESERCSVPTGLF
jgi:hypothetical protein